MKAGDKAGKRFAVFDIDGTVSRTSLYLASVHAMMRRGIISKTDAHTIEDSLQHWLARSDDQAFEAYSRVCIEVLDKALPSIKVSAYEEVVAEVLERFGHKIYRYPRQLIADLKAKGYLIFAVSGSEQALVSRFCLQHGFDDFIGNSFEHDGNYFTGAVGTTYKDKQIYVEELRQKHGCILDDSIAVGDTHGDIEMLAYVEQPIAFNPNQTLFAYAKAQGWKIVLERKNMIYELELHDGSYLLA